MAGERLWTLSSAERSILIIYSSELPHSWLGETTASSGPEIPNPHSHQARPTKAKMQDCVQAKLGNRGPNKSWKSIPLPSWRHCPVNPSLLSFPLLSFQSSSVQGSDPAQASQEPWFSVTRGQYLHLPPKAVGKIKWGNMWEHLAEQLSTSCTYYGSK